MPEKRIGNKLKQEIIKRASGCCEYCHSQARFAVQPFSVEHIFPRQQGGKTALDNLALACQGCNNHKYNKIEGYDPVNGEFVPLFNPRMQNWQDHFSWSNDFSLIVGLTPVGRATVETLKLNREGVVNLRRILYSVGEHPPEKSL